MTDLAHSHAELRGAVIFAGKEIRKLNFGRADNSTLAVLRRVLRDARVMAKNEGSARCIGHKVGFAQPHLRSVILMDLCKLQK